LKITHVISGSLAHIPTLHLTLRREWG